MGDLMRLFILTLSLTLVACAKSSRDKSTKALPDSSNGAYAYVPPETYDVMTTEITGKFLIIRPSGSLKDGVYRQSSNGLEIAPECQRFDPGDDNYWAISFDPVTHLGQLSYKTDGVPNESMKKPYSFSNSVYSTSRFDFELIPAPARMHDATFIFDIYVVHYVGTDCYSELIEALSAW